MPFSLSARIRLKFLADSINVFLSLEVQRCQAQYLALVSFFGIDDPGDPAIAHDHDAIRDAEQFGHFRRDDDDALVLLRQLQDELVNLELGPTSMPRVGSSSIRISGWVSSQ